VSSNYLVDIGEDPLDKRRRRRNIMRRVSAPIIGVVLLGATLLGVALYNYEANRSGVLHLSNEVLRELQGRISLEVESYLEPAYRANLLVHEMAKYGSFDTQYQTTERLAASMLGRIPQVDAFNFADPNGDFMMVRRGKNGGIDTKLIRNAQGSRLVIWIRRDSNGNEIARTTDPKDTYDPRSRPWYIGAVNTPGVYWTDPYIFFTAQVPGITAAIAYRDAKHTAYVFGVDISLKAISDFLASLKIGQHGRAVIFDRHGSLIAMPNVNRLIQRHGGDLIPAKIDAIGDPVLAAAWDRYRVEGYGQRTITVGGKRSIAIVAPLRSAVPNWSLVIAVPEADFTGFVARNSSTALELSIAVLLVATLLAVLLARQGLRIDREARALDERSQVTDRQIETFSELAANPEMWEPNQQMRPHMLPALLAKIMSAYSVSLWRLSDGGRMLSCEDSYCRDGNQRSIVLHLSQSEAPNFFSDLAAGRLIRITQETDPRVAELRRVIEHPPGKFVLTVAPVQHSGQVTGAVLVENSEEGSGGHGFLRVVARMLASRMPAASDASRGGKTEAALPSAVPVGERSFSDELARRGIDAEGLGANVYLSVAVMVVKFSDPVAMAMCPQPSNTILVDRVGSALQRLAIEHAIPYLKITGPEIVAAAGWSHADATALWRLADVALALCELCGDMFENSGLEPSFRLGLDYGRAMGGAVGSEPRLFNLWGEAVTVASLMAQTMVPGVIQVSERVHERLAGDFLFRPGGGFYLPRVGPVQTFILSARL
jgi:adenylate cyclase